MANQEHLALLQQGVDSWNTWRQQHPEIMPDLEDVDFERADLRGANFERADLRHANLHRANLSGANLELVHSQER